MSQDTRTTVGDPGSAATRTADELNNLSKQYPRRRQSRITGQGNGGDSRPSEVKAIGGRRRGNSSSFLENAEKQLYQHHETNLTIASS